MSSSNKTAYDRLMDAQDDARTALEFVNKLTSLLVKSDVLTSAQHAQLLDEMIVDSEEAGRRDATLARLTSMRLGVDETLPISH